MLTIIKNNFIDGVVTKPPASKLFYVPQKPYLALGTFRDQVRTNGLNN